MTDLHKAYGTTLLTYNAPAIAPRGECKSNWEVMTLLAKAMGFDEPWLAQSAEEVIDEVLAATAAHDPHFAGITAARLRAEGHVALAVPEQPPFRDGVFPTPSGKFEFACETLARQGYDLLPGRFRDTVDDAVLSGNGDEGPPLTLVSGASHHFVSSSLASQPGLLKNAGSPFVEIHPADAHSRGIADGDEVVLSNARGECRLRAVVSDIIRQGVVASPKGRWARLSGGSNVNWLTTDALGDMAGQSSYHSSRRLASPGVRFPPPWCRASSPGTAGLRREAVLPTPMLDTSGALRCARRGLRGTTAEISLRQPMHDQDGTVILAWTVAVPKGATDGPRDRPGRVCIVLAKQAAEQFGSQRRPVRQGVADAIGIENRAGTMGKVQAVFADLGTRRKTQRRTRSMQGCHVSAARSHEQGRMARQGAGEGSGVEQAGGGGHEIVREQVEDDVIDLLE